jgi:hypothetical protein
MTLWQRFKHWLNETTPVTELHCPVCGYYCLGNGGMGCIDKLRLFEIEQGRGALPDPPVQP